MCGWVVGQVPHKSIDVFVCGMTYSKRKPFCQVFVNGVDVSYFWKQIFFRRLYKHVKRFNASPGLSGKLVILDRQSRGN